LPLGLQRDATGRSQAERSLDGLLVARLGLDVGEAEFAALLLGQSKRTSAQPLGGIVMRGLGQELDWLFELEAQAHDLADLDGIFTGEQETILFEFDAAELARAASADVSDRGVATVAA
jgi:hypothetical protein